MMDIRKLSTDAGNFRKQGNYSEALQLYETLWTQHKEQCGEWEGWGYAYCLRKVGRSQEALDVCRWVYQMKPEFEHNTSLYGWCIYDLEFKGKSDEDLHHDEARFFKAANAVVQLTKPGAYSPYERVVFRVLDYLKSKNLYPTQQILDWTEKLDPSQLSDQSEVITVKDQQRELASPKENWYSLRTKALFEAARFEECIAVSQEALGTILTFHYNNDVWFKRRIALGKAELGQLDQAIVDLKEILRHKKEWFVQHELATLLLKADKIDDAFPYAIDAALNAGDVEYKAKLYILLGEIFEARGEDEIACQHMILAAKAYAEHDWRIPSELLQHISRFQINLEEEPRSSQDILHALRHHWESFKPRMKGSIKKLLPNGRSGFISGEDGRDYYFRDRDFMRRPEQLNLSTRVSFVPEMRWDDKKGCESASASKIREIRT